MLVCVCLKRRYLPTLLHLTLELRANGEILTPSWLTNGVTSSLTQLLTQTTVVIRLVHGWLSQMKAHLLNHTRRMGT